MTVTAVAHPEHVATDAPGTTWSTGSTTITAGRVYVAFVDQYRTDSTNPDLPTVTLDGAAMSQVRDDLWDTDGSSRRRMTAFALVAASGGSGVATATVASAPAMGNIQLTEVTLDGTQNGPITIQSAGGDVSGPAGTLQEIGALASLADAGNAIVAHVAANVDVSATARLELSSDSGGDADWTTGAITTNSSPSGCFVPGHIIGDADLTAGWYQNTGTPSAWLQAIEISGATVPAAVAAPYWGALLGAQTEDVVTPPAAGMFIGATVDPRNGNTIEQEIDDFEAALGVPKMDIIRRFDGSDPMPTSFYNAGNHGDDFQNDENVRHRAISVKGEPTQAELETFIATIPDDGYTTWLIVHHEPENDIAEGKLTHDEAWFQGMLDNLHGAWIAEGAPSHVVPSLCLMTWLERDSNPSTSSADWFPRSAIIDDFTLWLDPYDPNAIRTLQFLTEATVDLWEANGGGPWGIAETGTKRTGQDGADWITEGCAWARGRGAVGWCWFHSSVGNDGPWWLDDATMAAALGAEVVGV